MTKKQNEEEEEQAKMKVSCQRSDVSDTATTPLGKCPCFLDYCCCQVNLNNTFKG